MDSYKLGFIGAGVMGEAILGGAVRSGVISAADIFAYDVDKKRLSDISGRYSVNECAGLGELIGKSDIILLAVKPTVFQKILEEIAPKVHGKALFSIVAGWNSEKIKKYISSETRLLCIMPNMPAICGEGMSVLSANNSLLPGELQFALKVFGAFGETELLDEKYFDVVTGLSGSGPAFVFMFIEAMMSAGVYNGLPAKTARKLAVQTVLGAAKVLKSNDKHPAEMRDSVCTPAGTTIEGVFELEKCGFNGTVMSAVDKSTKKFRQMVNG